jgi:hypothetical protein
LLCPKIFFYRSLLTYIGWIQAIAEDDLIENIPTLDTAQGRDALLERSFNTTIHMVGD